MTKSVESTTNAILANPSLVDLISPQREIQIKKIKIKPVSIPNKDMSSTPKVELKKFKIKMTKTVKNEECVSSNKLPYFSNLNEDGKGDEFRFNTVKRETGQILLHSVDPSKKDPILPVTYKMSTEFKSVNSDDESFDVPRANTYTS
jgi:hypothetical protein